MFNVRCLKILFPTECLTGPFAVDAFANRCKIPYLIPYTLYLTPCTLNQKNITPSSLPSPAGIYIHVPFCLAKCPYCDFYSTTNLDRVEEYISALLIEMRLCRQSVDTIDTIYFGGGTPSLLTPEQLDLIFNHIQRTFTVKSDAEITLEVNPGTVNKNDLLGYRYIGINRLNIGLQAVNDKTLRFLGRVHSMEQGLDAYRWARTVGFDNVGLDLLYGVSGQNLHHWKKELANVAMLEPDHFSCYALTLETGTPMADRVAKGERCLADEKRVADMFVSTSRYLKQNRYDHYEISNFARIHEKNDIDRRSRHNRKYWNFVPYLGFGPAAHSYHLNTRWWNHRSLDSYLLGLTQGSLPIAGKETLNSEQQMIEFIYLGLRQKKGVGIREFSSRFATSPHDTFGSSLKHLLHKKLIKIESGRIQLTEEGFCFHESVVEQLLSCMIFPNSQKSHH